MKIKRVSFLTSFVIVLMLMVSIISAFSLSGMVVSVDKDGWEVDVVETTSKGESKDTTNSTTDIPGDTSASTIDLDEDAAKEIKDSIEEGNSLEIDIDGNDVEISLNEDGKVEIDDGVAVQTDETIVINEGLLSIEDEDGNFVIINILPAAAVEPFIASGDANAESKVKLEVEDGVPYYSIETKKKTRFLWIFPSTKTATLRVNAQTGQELGVSLSEEKAKKSFFSRLFGGLFGEDEPDAVRLISPGKLSVSEEAHVAEVLAMMEGIEDERENNLVESVEEDLPEPVVSELVVPVFDDVYNPEINMGSDRDCAILTQAMIDASNGSDIELDYDGGCISMEGNLDMDNKALILRGGFTFDCQDNYLAGVGDYGIVSYENTFVQNCIVEDRNVYGFYLSDSSSITDSTANYNNRGFQVQDFSSVTDSTANYNLRGFYLYASSTVTSSTSNSNYNNGFELSGSSIVTDSIAQNNVESGFILHINGSVTDSLAENNSVGFRSYNVGTVTDSIANGNSNVGFYLVSSSSVTDSTANDNDRGFLLFDSSSVIGSTASNNYDSGFGLGDSASVTDSTANDNWVGFNLHHTSSAIGSTSSNSAQHGFIVQDSSAVTDSESNNDHYGFWVIDSAEVSNSFSSNSDYDGFILSGGSVITSIARNNNRHGFSAYQISSILNSTAINNVEHGFVIGNASAENIVALSNGEDGIFIDSAGELLTGITSCGNGAHDIFSNFGIIDGTFYTENVGGVWNGDLNVRDCKYRPESNMDDFDLS